MQTKKNPGLGRLAEENAVQRHSKISNGRLSGLLCWPHGQDIENRSAQPDSKFSNGRLSGLLCWPHGQDIENRSAQRHSKICKSVLSLCLGASVVKCFSAQLDSKFSKFRKNQTLHFLHELHGEEMYSAQRHSKNSKSGRLSGLLCNWQCAQQHSKFSKSGNRPLSLLASKNTPVEQHSNISNFTKLSIVKQGLNYCPKPQVLSLCLCGSVVKCFSAQLDSKFSKFRKNQTLHFLHELHGEEMYSAQRHSKNSNSGWFVKTSPAQLGSKNSNFGEGGMGVMRRMGRMGWKTIIQTSPAQPDSKNSNFGNRPLIPLCLLSPLAPKTSSAQPDSKMSNFTKLSIVKQDLNYCSKPQVLTLCF